MLAKVIDERSPFYGMICEVGDLTKEGLYRISEKDAPWHRGYAHKSQLQYEMPLAEDEPDNPFALDRGLLGE